MSDFYDWTKYYVLLCVSYSMKNNDSRERNKWEKNEKINRKFFENLIKRNYIFKANSRLDEWMNYRMNEYSFYMKINKKWIK